MVRAAAIAVSVVTCLSIFNGPFGAAEEVTSTQVVPGSQSVVTSAAGTPATESTAIRRASMAGSTGQMALKVLI